MATGDHPEAVALIHDISSSGALLLTREQCRPREQLELEIQAGGGAEGPTLTTRASVIRCEPISYSELWRYQIAVQFNEPLTSGDEQLDSLAKLIERVSRASKAT